MQPCHILRCAALTAVALLPLALRADDTPADAKSAAKPEAPATEKRPEQLFKELDRNSDGKLTADEVPAERRTFFDHLVRSGDKDKNGELTLAEFLEGLKPVERRAAPAGELPTGTFVPDPARFFQRLDLNGDGKLALGELPEPLRERMKPLYDRLGKTEIDRDEFAKVAERMRREGGLPMPGDRGRMEGRGGPLFFRKLDKNGDGKLSKEELQKAGEIFDDLDANKDGLLDVRELFGPRPGGDGAAEDRQPAAPTSEKAATPEASGKPKAAAAADAPEKPAVPPAIAAKGIGKKDGKGPLRKFDTNGDGKVSRDEAQGRLRKNFDKLDANRDGFLDRDELRKALQEIKPGKQDQGLKA